ncbi:MAG: hypothetical protein M1281_16380 [Chloroflexi bacterium]|nr:hypothetical protein [Chloroflexota bacterium]
MPEASAGPPSPQGLLPPLRSGSAARYLSSPTWLAPMSEIIAVLPNWLVNR